MVGVLTMHPEIETALRRSFEGFPDPSEIAQYNAVRLIENIMNKGLYEMSVLNTTWSGGLSIYLAVKEWQFHMQSTNDGRIWYILWKGPQQCDSGCDFCDEYIPKLTYYLNIIKFRN
jgi:hypothetical protein